MTDEKQTISLNNAAIIAQRILDSDISGMLIHDYKKYELDIEHLRECLHAYRYGLVQNRPQEIPIIDWIEQCGQQLIQQTERCIAQLTDDTKKTLFQSDKPTVTG